MTTTIRATCPLCEQAVDLAPEDVTLHLVSAAADAPNSYGFTCPSCGVFAVRHATPGAIDLLLRGDVLLAVGDAPWQTGDVPGVVMIEPHMLLLAPPAASLDLAEVDAFAASLDDDAIHAWLEAA